MDHGIGSTMCALLLQYRYLFAATDMPTKIHDKKILPAGRRR